MIVEVSGTAREDEPGSPLNIRFYYTHAGHARCCRLSAQAEACWTIGATS